MSYQVPDWTFYIILKENNIEIKKFFMTSIMNSPTVKDWCSKPKMKNVPQCQTSLTIAFVFLIFGVDTGKITFWIFSSRLIDILKIQKTLKLIIHLYIILTHFRVYNNIRYFCFYIQNLIREKCMINIL